MHFNQNMSSVWVVFLVVTMVHQVYQSISSYLWSHDGKLPSRASNKQLPEAVQWESTSMLFEATSIQWCGSISLKESTGFLKQLSDSNGLVLVIKPWCTISKWFKMQRMLEPFMHLVASFGGGNGIDVYKKQTCTVQGWQINTNQLAFPQILQTHKFKTFRAFRIRAVIRWRLADPATGFKFCKTTKPGSWRNNLRNSSTAAEVRCWSPGFFSFLSPVLVDSHGAMFAPEKEHESPSGFCQENHFHKPNNTVFCFSVLTSSLLTYGAKWNSHTTRSAQDLLSACR